MPTAKFITLKSRLTARYGQRFHQETVIKTTPKLFFEPGRTHAERLTLGLGGGRPWILFTLCFPAATAGCLRALVLDSDPLVRGTLVI